jgi:hypothetical protein
MSSYRIIDEFQSSLTQKRGEMANLNQESGCYDNLQAKILQRLNLRCCLDEFQSSLTQKRGEMANLNQESGCYDNLAKILQRLNLRCCLIKKYCNSLHFGIRCTCLQFLQPLFNFNKLLYNLFQGDIRPILWDEFFVCLFFLMFM